MDLESPSSDFVLWWILGSEMAGLGSWKHSWEKSAALRLPDCYMHRRILINPKGIKSI